MQTEFLMLLWKAIMDQAISNAPAVSSFCFVFIYFSKHQLYAGNFFGVIKFKMLDSYVIGTVFLSTIMEEPPWIRKDKYYFPSIKASCG